MDTFGPLLMTVLGVLFGIFIGVLPGLTATMAIALLTPFSYYLGPVESIALLLGVYVGAVSFGSIPAVLVGIPGTPASMATCLDGFPMAKSGRAGEAIRIVAVSSFIGGIVGLIALVGLAPVLARTVYHLGSPEYFAVGLLGLSLCTTIASKSLLKGVISGLAGLLLALVGIDEIGGTTRFTFGRVELLDGIPFVPAMVGLFGLAELMQQSETRVRYQVLIPAEDTRQVRRAKWTLVFLGSLRGGILGTIVGALPGTGAAIASFLSYDVAKRLSKTPSEFGTGSVEGIVASESANNGVTGGALIPLLTFGIPGDSATAVLLGTLMIHGLQPGPRLVAENPVVMRAIFANLAFANVVTLVITIALAGWFARIILLPKRILTPIITILCVVGAFALGPSLFNVGVMIGFGILGYLMNRLGFSTVAMVLGLILGQMIESNFRRSLLISDGDLTIFLTRPITASLLIVTLLVISGPLWSRFRKRSTQ